MTHLAYAFLPIVLHAALASAQPGQLDPLFNTDGGGNNSMFCTALQPDGRILVGGAFSDFGGAAANRIARMMEDGTPDLAFNAAVGLIGLEVYSICVQPDGKILVGGNFSSVGGVLRSNIARLNADGSLDAAFQTSASGAVRTIHRQSDGHILVGGIFTLVNGVPRSGIARLTDTGTIDSGFTVGGGFNNAVWDIHVDPNGRIVACGVFTVFNGAAANGIVVLNADGSRYTTFAPTGGTGGFPRCTINTSTGSLLVGGDFDTFNGVSRSALVALNPDGSIDPAYGPGSGFTSAAFVFHLAEQPDGMVLCSGNFATYNGTTRNAVVRILSNGAVDPDFAPAGSAGAIINEIAIQPDGKAVVAGTFTTFNGATMNRIARIFLCSPITWYLDADGDGSGDPAETRLACADPAGYVANSSDCDDTDPFMPTTWYRDLDEDGTGDPAVSLTSCTEQSGYVLNNMDCDDADPDIFQGSDCDDNDPTTVEDRYDESCECLGGAVDVAVKVFLQGPFNGTTMTDALRAAALIPLTEPYTELNFHPSEGGGGETIEPSVLTVTGPDAIVDWVMLALRPDYDPTERKNIRMALLQRDGDVVDLDGTSPVRFPEVPDAFFLEVRHRNHLGIMTAAPMTPVPTGTMTTVDFTSPGTACYGTNARKQSGSAMVMWMGMTTKNGFLSYTGTNNDRDPILVRVGSTTPGNAVSGYFTEDCTMNGLVQYTGSGNDRDPILVNVGGTTPQAVRMEQLP